MNRVKDMPVSGIAVIIVISVLFILAVIFLLTVYSRYRRTSRRIGAGKLEQSDEFLRYTVNEYAGAYKRYGQDVNTPAIIASAFGTKMPGALLGERFLNNAVSLFVTLGLFGTFLGLSYSVSSLTELIGYSNTSEWLSVLDSVGGGLISALSGMGVAFYTSLVGVAASILLTVLRVIFNPANEREKLAAQMELWLDHTVAPTLPTKAAKDDATLVHEMIDALNETANAIEGSLRSAGEEFGRTMDEGRAQLVGFQTTVNSFNEGVRDFSEFNYNLRGTVERMDVSIRDLVSALRETSRTMSRGADR